MPRGGLRTRVSEDEKNTIRNMLKSGMTTAQIVDATGRSDVTIGRIRNELKLDGFDIWHRPGAVSQFTPVANTGSKVKEEAIEENVPDEIEIPDIPEIPTFEAKEPEVVEQPKEEAKSASSIEVIKKMAKFNGRKTGFGYIATSENDYLTIRNDGVEFKIESSHLESFIDELIDITEEVKKFKNSL